MKRSLIHQVSYLVDSRAFTQRSSFITTSRTERSCINKKRKFDNHSVNQFSLLKENDKQKFIVVFQAIEIERLSQEIQAFKGELKMYEREISTKQNYEVQIKQIMQKCHKYYSQRQQLVNLVREIMKMNDKNVNKFISQFSGQLAKQITAQVNQKINKKKYFTMLSQQIVQLNGDMNKAMASLNTYNRQLDLQQLQDRLVKVEQQNAQTENLVEKMLQYQNQIKRLDRVLQGKNIQLQAWKTKYRKLESTYSQLNHFNGNSVTAISPSRLRHAEQERQRFQDEIKFKNSQINQWKAKCVSLQRTVNNYKVIQKQKKGLEQQLNYQVRISDDYERKLRYLQDAASHLHQLENQLKNEQSRRMQYIQQVQRLNGIIQIKSLESQNLNRKIISLQDQIRGLKAVQRQLFDEKQKSQHISEELIKLNKAFSQKSAIITSLKQQFGKKSLNNSQKDEVKRLLDTNMKQINDLFDKLEQSNKQNDQLQLQIMAVNSQITGLKTEINLAKQEKQSVNAICYQKSQQCENYKKQMNARMDEIRDLRKFESANYQYQAKIKNLEQNYIDIERRYNKECYKTEELYRLHSNAKSDIDKIKREGYIPPDFLNEFTVLKKNYQLKERELKDVENRCLIVQKALKGMKKVITQQNQMAKTNNQKWLKVNKALDAFKYFADNALQCHAQMSKLKEDNIYLESSKRLMTFELTHSKNILSNSYIQQSESVTSQKTDKFSPDERTKMSTQRSTIGSSVKGNIMRKSAIEPSGDYQNRSNYQSRFVNQNFK